MSSQRRITDFHPAGQFLIMIMIILGCMVFMGMIIKFSLPLLFDMAYDPTDENFSAELLKRPDVSVYMQIVASAFLFLVPALIFAFLQTTNPAKYLRLDKAPSIKLLALSIGIILTANVFAYIFFHFIDALPLPDKVLKFFEDELSSHDNLINTFFARKDPLFLSIVFFMIAILPAVGEEFLFRGVLQRFMTEHGRSTTRAIIWSGLAFALIHGLMYSLLSLFFLGCVLGWLYYRTQNLWYAIIAHFVNNGLQVGYFIYVVLTGDESINVDDADTFPWYVSLLSGVFMAGLMYLFWKNTDPPEHEYQEIPTNTTPQEDDGI